MQQIPSVLSHVLLYFEQVLSQTWLWIAFIGLGIALVVLLRRKLSSRIPEYDTYSMKILYYTVLVSAFLLLVIVLLDQIESQSTVNPILQTIILVSSAFLTFMAFWIQYQFNKVQKEDIVKDRFENKFYRNLELVLKLEDACSIPHVGKGKQAFHFMFYEYKAIMSNILISDKVDWMAVAMEQNKFDGEDFWRKVNQISFNIFISGVSTSAKARLYKDCGVTRHQIDELNNYLIKRQHVKKSPIYLDDYDCAPIRLYDGHRLRLVSFFRNVCMLVQYVINDDPLLRGVSYDGNLSDNHPLLKDYYLLYFLSLLSEHEISLLYIIYLYSTDEHVPFYDATGGVNAFFTKVLPKFIMASNMRPDNGAEFLNVARLRQIRRDSQGKEFFSR